MTPRRHALRMRDGLASGHALVFVTTGDRAVRVRQFFRGGAVPPRRHSFRIRDGLTSGPALVLVTTGGGAVRARQLSRGEAVTRRGHSGISLAVVTP